MEWVAASGKSLTTIYATHDEILSFGVDGARSSGSATTKRSGTRRMRPQRILAPSLIP